MPAIPGLTVPREFYWVLQSPAPLAGMQMPSLKTPWQALAQAGFRFVVRLARISPCLDPAPLSVLYAADMEDLQDGGPPQDPETEERTLHEAVRLIVPQLQAGNGVVVHCVGGRGRTGTVLGCVLRVMGYNDGEIIANLDRLHKKRGKLGWPEAAWQATQMQNFKITIPELGLGELNRKCLSIPSQRSMNLKERIRRIGHQLVRCENNCGGIALPEASGVPPRCLIYEDENREKGKGLAIVGFNPGKAPAREIQYYRNGENKAYGKVVDYWYEHVGYRHRYYTRLRKVTEAVELKGPILWTELAKCQNAEECKSLPLNTLRKCTNKFLNQEMKVIPKEWPILAVGKEAFKAVAYLFPDRNVIGVPHATSARGQFDHLFKGGKVANAILKNNIFAEVFSALNGQESQAVWLHS